MDDNSKKDIYSILGQIVKLHFSRCHNYLDEVGIYPGQSALLCKLNEEDGQSQRELCDKLKVKPATITVMIKRMEKAGLIKREEDKIDKRISRIFITESGKSIIEKIRCVHSELKQECFKNLTDDELVILRRLLIQIRDNLQ